MGDVIVVNQIGRVTCHVLVMTARSGGVVRQQAAGIVPLLKIQNAI
jgi:hypothetical protein